MLKGVKNVGQKVVVNKCFGGFSISKEAAQYMANLGNERARKELEDKSKDQWYGLGYVDDFEGGYSRTDPDLIAAIESLGEAANGWLAKLAIVEIPHGVEWDIEEYDGSEWVAEKHRTW